MEFTNAELEEKQEMENDSAETSANAKSIKKYTYVLPSGRKLKVVVDDGSEFVETACSSPCFLLRIEDEAVG